jgi:hypothetical protein
MVVLLLNMKKTAFGERKRFMRIFGGHQELLCAFRLSLRWHYPDQVHKGMISAFRHPYADDAYSIFTAVQIKQKVIVASRGVFKFRDFLQ